jgi:hypothetical protein
MKLRVIIALLSAALLTLALSLVSSAGTPPCALDVDTDGICDIGDDNCLGIPNPAQRDDDEDGYGNICDQDVTQDCVIGFPDVSGVFGNIGNGAVWTPKNSGAYDVNEDNVVGFPDVSNVFGNIGQAMAGRSARACADCTATPTAGLNLGVCP